MLSKLSKLFNSLVKNNLLKEASLIRKLAQEIDWAGKEDQILSKFPDESENKIVKRLAIVLFCFHSFVNFL